MDIHSGKKWPSKALSNFSPHPFTMDGVEIASMEGFLQSLKFFNPEMQKEICKLVGRKAKMKGSKKNWQTYQKLYWQGEVFARNGKEYQHLLNRAYATMALASSSFRKALLATGDAELTHTIGRKRKNETILTRKEFCSKLMKLRESLRSIT